MGGKSPNWNQKDIHDVVNILNRPFPSEATCNALHSRSIGKRTNKRTVLPTLQKKISFVCKLGSIGKQGWRGGIALASHQCGPGSIPDARRHMWVVFVVGSLLCSERFFSGYSGFSLSSRKRTFDLIWVDLISRKYCKAHLITCTC